MKKNVNLGFTSSEDSDQALHPLRLIRANTTQVVLLVLSDSGSTRLYTTVVQICPGQI